jgi:hypothetical protein
MFKQAIEELFTYHPPTGDQAERYNVIREKAKQLGHTIVECTPESADQTAAIRLLREAVMTANASIALENPQADEIRREKYPNALGQMVEAATPSGLNIVAPIFTIEDIAKMCHEANKTLCEIQGDFSQVSWHDAEAWQQSSALAGVLFCLQNPNAPPSANHESWLEEKRATGWQYGPIKNVDAKEHPCFVPYDELPPEQKAKDYLFKAIVSGMSPFVKAPDA